MIHSELLPSPEYYPHLKEPKLTWNFKHYCHNTFAYTGEPSYLLNICPPHFTHQSANVLTTCKQINETTVLFQLFFHAGKKTHYNQTVCKVRYRFTDRDTYSGINVYFGDTNIESQLSYRIFHYKNKNVGFIFNEMCNNFIWEIRVDFTHRFYYALRYTRVSSLICAEGDLGKLPNKSGEEVIIQHLNAVCLFFLKGRTS